MNLLIAQWEWLAANADDWRVKRIAAERLAGRPWVAINAGHNVGRGWSQRLVARYLRRLRPGISLPSWW
jgi:hypothetical protein